MSLGVQRLLGRLGDDQSQRFVNLANVHRLVNLVHNRARSGSVDWAVDEPAHMDILFRGGCTSRATMP